MTGTASEELPKGIDLAPYGGRWVAIVRGRVTGVGASASQARLASKYQRPKEEPLVIFVPTASDPTGKKKNRGK